jgi:hypothetical protein
LEGHFEFLHGEILIFQNQFFVIIGFGERNQQFIKIVQFVIFQFKMDHLSRQVMLQGGEHPLQDSIPHIT